VTKAGSDFKSYVMLYFAYLTGCRLGEIARTKIQDEDIGVLKSLLNKIKTTRNIEAIMKSS